MSLSHDEIARRFANGATIPAARAFYEGLYRPDWVWIIHFQYN